MARGRPRPQLPGAPARRPCTAIRPSGRGARARRGLRAGRRRAMIPVMTPQPIAEQRFIEVFNLAEKHLEDRYELPVVISDVPNPFTGDLDGAEIRVDYDLNAEESLFILVHLFGHTVQWNLSAANRELGKKVEANVPESRLAEIQDYERTACAYSLQLLHDLGVHDLDQ